MFHKGHALVVGVGKYSNILGADVPIAVTDALTVADILKDPTTCGYPPEQVRVLTNEAATRAATLTALDELAKQTGEGDTVFLFYCGHGALGEDGNYYFVNHDTQINQGKVIPGTGVSEAEFIEKLRAIKTERILVTLNTCYSGQISPSLSIEGEGNAFQVSTPPQTTSSAILATGKGRIIITAAREDQRSYIGKGQQSFFTQALTDALRGKGVTNHRGFISAFELYEYVYETVFEAVEKQIKEKQEPELTVLKGVGPFAVALYKGSSSLGEFDSFVPAPQTEAVQEVSLEKARKLMDQILRNRPNINIHNSPGTVVGDIGGDNVVSNIEQNNNQIFRNSPNAQVYNLYKSPSEFNIDRTVNTGGGAYIGGNVSTTGDFIGRDRVSYGNEIEIRHMELMSLIAPLYSEIGKAELENQQEALQTVKAIEQEVERWKNGNDYHLAQLLEKLVNLIPEAVSTVIRMFNLPLLSAIVGPATKAVLNTICTK